MILFGKRTRKCARRSTPEDCCSSSGRCVLHTLSRSRFSRSTAYVPLQPIQLRCTIYFNINVFFLPFLLSYRIPIRLVATLLHGFYDTIVRFVGVHCTASPRATLSVPISERRLATDRPHEAAVAWWWSHPNRTAVQSGCPHWHLLPWGGHTPRNTGTVPRVSVLTRALFEANTIESASEVVYGSGHRTVEIVQIAKIWPISDGWCCGNSSLHF